MIRKIIPLIFLCFFFSTGKVWAFKAETYVTFANQVRGPEGWQVSKQTPLDLPLYQYQESTSSALPITWLLRFDAVNDATMSSFFNLLVGKDKNQSLGALLEITPSLTEAASVSYPSGNSPYDANRLLLSGYSMADRQRLIDTYMDNFFVHFGYYPKSVSASHLDSYSLQYLQSKYSVLTAMSGGEAYQSPYFPDKHNSLIPASSFANRVNLALVPRNPGPGQETLDSLLNFFSQRGFNEFSFVNLGLENDLDLIQFKKDIKSINRTVAETRGKYNLHPIGLAEFGDWMKSRYPESSPAYFYHSLDTISQAPVKIYWYQSPFYRLGLKSISGKTSITDFRVYNREIYEDYFATPNQDPNLHREIPAIIDSEKFPATEVSLDIDLKNADIVRSKQWDYWQTALWVDGKMLTLQPDRIIFSNFQAPQVNSKDIKHVATKNQTVWQLTPHTPFKNVSRPTWILWLLTAVVVLKLIKRYKHSGKPRLPIYLIVGVLISLVAGLTVFRSGLLYPFGMGFWGPNGHDALFHLSLIEKFSASPFSFSHPQIAGEKIANYHFLFDFISGLVVKLSGLSALDLYFRVFPVLAGLTIVFLLDKLLQTWQCSRPTRLLALLLVFLAGSFGFVPKLLMGQDIFTGESAFWSNQSVSIFLNPPYALSIIVLLWFLVILAKAGIQVNNPTSSRPTCPQTLERSSCRREWRDLTLSTSLFLMFLGGLLAQTKVYAFILLLGALLFSKKYKLFIGVLLVGILISLPFTTFAGQSPFIFSPFWFPRSLFASFDRVYWPRLVEAWQAYEASGNFVKLGLINFFALVVFLLGNLGIRCLGLIHLSRTKSSSDSENVVRWIIAFGLLLPLFFVQNINPWNTIQFMYYALFFLGIFTAQSLLAIAHRAKYLALLSLILILLAISTSFGTLKDYFGYYSSSRISYTELLALEELRNLPKGIVLSPLFSEVSGSRISAPKPLYSYVSTAYISGLTGQPEFLADMINLDITGFAYSERARDIQRFYSTEDQEWGKAFLQNNHIKYVYETRLQKLKLPPSALHLEKIFDSGEINIYKFN